MESNLSKIFHFRSIKNVKSPTLSCFIILAFLVLIILVGNLSLESVVSKTAGVSKVIPVRTIASLFPLGSRPAHEDESEKPRSVKQDALAPPRNSSSRGRIKWLLKHISRFEILRTSNLSEQFHGRVVEFLDGGCEAKFFMTWISPVEFFGPREILSMESVFNAHPRGCLTLLSSRMDSPQGYRVLKPLMDRGFRILAVTPNLSFLLENTPAQVWLEDLKAGKKDPGIIPLSQNLSNLMRLAVLHKYGGIYLDTDFIVLRSFRTLKNSIGAQTMDADSHWTRLNNAVIIFDQNHTLLLKFIEEFASTFNGNRWGHNGPYLVTRVVQRIGGTPGNNFTVLPPSAFYPVNWIEIERLFKTPESPDGPRWVEARVRELENVSYGLHLWNKFSRKFAVQEGSAIEKLFSNNCVICHGVHR